MYSAYYLVCVQCSCCGVHAPCKRLGPACARHPSIWRVPANSASSPTAASSSSTTWWWPKVISLALHSGLFQTRATVIVNPGLNAGNDQLEVDLLCVHQGILEFEEKDA